MIRDIIFGSVKNGRYEMIEYQCKIFDKVTGKQVIPKSGKVYLLTEKGKLQVYSVKRIKEKIFPKDEHFSSYSLSSFVTRE